MYSSLDFSAMLSLRAVLGSYQTSSCEAVFDSRDLPRLQSAAHRASLPKSRTGIEMAGALP